MSLWSSTGVKLKSGVFTGSEPASGSFVSPMKHFPAFSGYKWLLLYHSYSFPIGGGIGCQEWRCSLGHVAKVHAPGLQFSDSGTPKHLRTQDIPDCCRIEKGESSQGLWSEFPQTKNPINMLLPYYVLSYCAGLLRVTQLLLLNRVRAQTFHFVPLFILAQETEENS